MDGVTFCLFCCSEIEPAGSIDHSVPCKKGVEGGPCRLCGGGIVFAGIAIGCYRRGPELVLSDRMESNFEPGCIG